MSKIHALMATASKSERNTPMGLFSYITGKTISVLGADAYGQKITEYLIEQFDGLVDPGQVYMTLKRLEARRLATCKNERIGGATVKVYTLTNEGREALVTTAGYIAVAAKIGEQPGRGRPKKTRIAL